MAQDNSPEYWDNRLGDYSIDQLFGLIESEPMTKFMLEYFPKNSRILDAGCGVGIYVFYLLKKGYDIQGIDFSQKRINRAKKYAKESGLKENLFNVGNVIKTEFGDSFFDVYIARGVLHQLEKEEQKRMLREAHRLLKEGGIIFISIIKFLSIYTMLRELREMSPLKQNLVRVTYMTKYRLRCLVESCGFKCINMFDDKPFWSRKFINTIFIGKRVRRK